MAMWMPEVPRDEDEIVTIYECIHCGDGDALRVGEACAYCGREQDDE
jgi:hypothetical protein